MPEIVSDIREYKRKLREKYKNIRRCMDTEIKGKKDSLVFNRVINLTEYKNSDIIITYVSTGIEVDTINLIEHALKNGKTVAVPKCVKGTRKMDFYVINSLSELKPGAYSLLEPDVSKCRKLLKFDGAVCIVPALVYDSEGYRIGYGGGYYDRFISEHKSVFRIGIGYCCCTVNKLFRGRFDMPVDLLITEKYIKKTSFR